MRALAICLCLLLAPAAAAAQATTSAPSRERVRELLSGFEQGPDDAAWRRLGDGALPVLIALYQDAREAPYVRLRAVGASAAFARPATRTFLLAVARAEGQSDLFVREAVRGLARAFGQAGVEDLVPFLAHGEPVVREAAAASLTRLGGERAQTALRARRAVERDPLVVRALRD